jgi:aspartate oxidase
LNFGNIDASGTSKPKKVTLTNKGHAAAQISGVTATVAFTIAGGPNACSGETIAPKKTCSFYVQFAPTSVADATGGIDVIYNGTSPSVVLEGNGIASR